jgi:hypothetical protein
MISLLVIGLIVGGYFLYNYQMKVEQNKAYSAGYQYGIQYLAAQQTQTGNIAYYTNQTGNWTISTISIKELCGVEKG